MTCTIDTFLRNKTEHQSIVIMVGKRYFSEYKNKRVLTAWSLTGAKLFQPIPDSKEEILKYVNILKSKGYKPFVSLIIKTDSTYL